MSVKAKRVNQPNQKDKERQLKSNELTASQSFSNVKIKSYAL